MKAPPATLCAFALITGGLPLLAMRVVGTQIRPGAARITSSATLTIRIEKDRQEYTVDTPTEMTTIEQTVVTDDKAVILGHSDYLSEAVIVCGSTMIPERAIGYSMQLLGKWLVGIEFYPNHMPPSQTATDVVLVRNIETLPCKSTPDVHSNGIEHLVRAAGRPVYPTMNATKHSYQNVLEGQQESFAVYPKTFVILPNDRLAFVVAQFSKGKRGPAYIVSIDLGGKTSAIKRYSLDRVADSLGLVSASQMEISGAVSAGGSSVLLQLQKGAYKQDSVVVPLD
jgi:hypothetical protein